MHLTGLTFKRVHGNAKHLEIGKTLHLVRDCLLWPNWQKQQRLLHWEPKGQVRLLKCIWTVCCLANFVYSLFNGKMVQMVRRACWYPLSSTDPNNTGHIWKIMLCILRSLLHFALKTEYYRFEIYFLGLD